MGTLSTFLPFFAFVGVSWAVDARTGLLAAFVAASVRLLEHWKREEQCEPAAYDLCIFALFALLALYDGFGEPAWTATGILVRVEVGLLLCVLGSVALRQPCTLRAAYGLPGGELQREAALFLRINNVLCAAWGLAFTAMIAGEVLRQVWPDTDPFASPLVMVFSTSAAECFCRWYVERGGAG